MDAPLRRAVNSTEARKEVELIYGRIVDKCRADRDKKDKIQKERELAEKKRLEEAARLPPQQTLVNLIDNRINARNAEAMEDEGEDDGALEIAEEFAQAVQNPGNGEPLELARGPPAKPSLGHPRPRKQQARADLSPTPRRRKAKEKAKEKAKAKGPARANAQPMGPARAKARAKAKARALASTRATRKARARPEKVAKARRTRARARDPGSSHGGERGPCPCESSSVSNTLGTPPSQPPQ